MRSTIQRVQWYRLWETTTFALGVAMWMLLILGGIKLFIQWWNQ